MIKEMTLEDFISAHNRIKPYIYNTPFYELSAFPKLEAHIYLKLENQQKTHSFKWRSALNKLLLLSDEEKERGIMAISSGNHGISVSCASKLLGIKNTIVFVPKTTPCAKVDQIKEYGAEVIITGDSYDEMKKIGMDYLAKHNLVFLDPFNKDYEIYAGQGTVAIEMLMERPELDTIVVPLGGGGLVTGAGYAAKLMKPSIRVIGVQTEACPAFVKSLEDETLYSEYPEKPTVCEALMGGAGEVPYQLAKVTMDKALVVTEESVKDATRLLIQREKMIVEPAGAIGVAALSEYPELFMGSHVGIVISGGNIDDKFVSVKFD